METFNLNLIPSGTCPVCHVSQYDIGRQFRINLFEGSSVFTLSGAETITVYVRKPDGNMVTESVTNTSSTYVIIETTEQMTACDGASLCELRIQNGADVIGTANFILECEKSPDTGITSQTEINNLETLVDGFTAQAVADQYDSANVIFDNTPTSGHGTGYTVTSDGIKTALDTKVTATATNVKTQITWNETTASGTGAYRVGNMVFITYQGESKTHANGDTLFNIPASLRPVQNWEQSFTVDGKTYGQVHLISSSGNCNINIIADNTQTGRIYFSVAYPIA